MNAEIKLSIETVDLGNEMESELPLMISAAKSAQYQGTTMETVPAAIGSAVEV
jgi:hypothetical protein